MSQSNIPELEKDDIYSITLLLLFVFKDDPKYSTLSELSYILDHENFIKFIKYYEGQTITIPPIKQISQSLRILLLYQYYIVEKMPWGKALSKAGFEPDENVSARRLLYSLKKSIEKYKIGDFLNGNKN